MIIDLSYHIRIPIANLFAFIFPQCYIKKHASRYKILYAEVPFPRLLALVGVGLLIMTMNGFYIEVTNKLIEPKHVKAIGPAIWEFMWLLDKMTKIDTEAGTGLILGGKPIKLDDLAKDIGRHKDTISTNIKRLVEHGYIDVKHAPYGLIITVHKAKKRFGRNTEPVRENTKPTTAKTPNLIKTVNSKTKQYDNNTNVLQASPVTRPKRRVIKNGMVVRKNADIDALVGVLETSLDGVPLDGSVQENRRYGHLLINKLKKLCKKQGQPEDHAVGLAQSIIQAAFQDEWHSVHATSIKYIYYNMGKIINEHKLNQQVNVI